MGNLTLSDLSRPKANRTIELRLIGALIRLENPSDIRVHEIMLEINDEHFYFRETKDLFNIIKKSYEKHYFFDYSSIESIVGNTDLFMFFIQAYKEQHATLAHISQDIEDLKILSSLRRNIPVLMQSLIDCHNENMPSACDEAINNGLSLITCNKINDKSKDIESYEQIIDRILSSSEDSHTSLTLDITGFPPLPRNQMISIAGRSGAGKSYFALYFMNKIQIKEPNKQTLYFNLEMKQEDLVKRHAKLVTAVDGKNDKETVKIAAPILLKNSFNIISDPDITIEEIEIMCRIESLKKPLSIIVIDYIGRVKTKQKFDSKSKHLQQSDIANRLSSLAISLKCIVIVLLQVNRDYKTRDIGDRCPYPTDSAESTGCERSSALWLGIDQPSLDDEEDPRFKDLFVIKNRKSREDTGLFTYYMHFREGRFYEVDQNQIKRQIDNRITDINDLKKAKY